MATEETTDSSAIAALHARIDELEREQHERTARANDALAAAQDRAYWLDRWNLDLNALMRRRGASELRAGMRAARALYRAFYRARYRLADHAHSVPLRASLARQAIQEERDHGQEVGGDRFPRTLSPDLLRAAPVTELLHARLQPEDVAAIEAVLEPAEAALWETADELERKRLALAFAAHRQVEPAHSRSGL